MSSEPILAATSMDDPLQLVDVSERALDSLSEHFHSYMEFMNSSSMCFERIRTGVLDDAASISTAIETLNRQLSRCMGWIQSDLGIFEEVSGHFRVLQDNNYQLKKKLHSVEASLSITQAQLSAVRESHINEVSSKREAMIDQKNVIRKTFEPTGNIALVFTDVQGSTALWDAAPQIVRVALMQHNELMRETARKHDGYEVKTEGDAFMMAFQRPDQALEWCCDAQRALLHSTWPDEILQLENAAPFSIDGQLLFQGLRVRMGLNTGRPLCERDPTNNRMDYFGPPVNLCARISSTAFGGEIVVGQAAHAVLTTDPAFAAKYVVSLKGEVSLKGIPKPECIYTVLPRDLTHRVVYFRTLDRSKRLENSMRLQQWITKVHVGEDIQKAASREVEIQMNAEAKIQEAEKARDEAISALKSAEERRQAAEALLKHSEHNVQEMIASAGALTEGSLSTSSIFRYTKNAASTLRFPPSAGSKRGELLKVLVSAVELLLRDPKALKEPPPPAASKSEGIAPEHQRRMMLDQDVVASLSFFASVYRAESMEKGQPEKEKDNDKVNVPRSSDNTPRNMPWTPVETKEPELEVSPATGFSPKKAKNRRQSNPPVVETPSAVTPQSQPPTPPADSPARGPDSASSRVKPPALVVEAVETAVQEPDSLAASPEGPRSSTKAVRRKSSFLARSPQSSFIKSPQSRRKSNLPDPFGEDLDDLKTVVETKEAEVQVSIGYFPYLESDTVVSSGEVAVLLRDRYRDAQEQTATLSIQLEAANQQLSTLQEENESLYRQREAATQLRDIALDELETAAADSMSGSHATAVWRAEAKGVLMGVLRIHRYIRKFVAVLNNASFTSDTTAVVWLQCMELLRMEAQQSEARALVFQLLKNRLESDSSEDAALADARNAINSLQANTQAAMPPEFVLERSCVGLLTFIVIHVVNQLSSVSKNPVEPPVESTAEQLRLPVVPQKSKR